MHRALIARAGARCPISTRAAAGGTARPHPRAPRRRAIARPRRRGAPGDRALLPPRCTQRDRPRLDAATTLVGQSYRSLSIRAQRTRWASCTERGAMSFNWRLLLAPERVLEYVIWHEVCHLEILDHSPRSGRCWSGLAELPRRARLAGAQRRDVVL